MYGVVSRHLVCPSPPWCSYNSMSCSEENGGSSFVNIERVRPRGLVFDRAHGTLLARRMHAARGRFLSVSCRLLLLRVYGFKISFT